MGANNKQSKEDIMAHFHGTVRGSRGEASRLGTKATGLEARAAGWTLGATARIMHNEKTGEDSLVITIDQGNGDNDGRALNLVMSESDLLELLDKNPDDNHVTETLYKAGR